MAKDESGSRILTRPLRDDEDFRRVRDLLVATYPITPLGFNWDVRRWDGWRYYRANPDWDHSRPARLWETEDGTVVGAVFSERRGDAHVQLHPEFRPIEEQVVAWAEERLATTGDAAPAGGGSGTQPAGSGAGCDPAASREEPEVRRLRVFVYENDRPRRDLLRRRGYTETASRGVIRRSCFDGGPRPRPALAWGYRLRATRAGDEGDARRIADLLNAAFGRDFHTADEYLVFARHAPSFRADLDLVAEAPDGSFAAYAGVPYDDVNRRGIFEPVCTHPEHRRKGLARDLMLEAMQRLEALGASDVTVETGDAPAANLLYDALGFRDRCHGAVWLRARG